MTAEAALNFGLDRPLYLQLLDWLREDLSRRQPGALIDSEPQLARRFGVSRFTVTRAIEILVRDGLLTRRQGLGTFVAPPRLRRAPTYLRSFTEAMAAEGRTATHRLSCASLADERAESVPACPKKPTAKITYRSMLVGRIVRRPPNSPSR